MTDRDPGELMQIRLGEIRYVPAPDPAPSGATAPDAVPGAEAGQRSRPLLLRITWSGIDNLFTTLRSVILNALLLLGVVAVLLFAWFELRRDAVVIEPIRLAGPLADMGYSEDVAAHRLWDDVALINDSTPTAKDRVTLLPASERMDFDAPGAGISVQTVLQMIRPFIGFEETRISGEFLCTTEDCAREGLALRVRVFRGGATRIISLPTVGEVTGSGDIDAYFHEAALDLLRELDPYVVAFYLYQTDKDAAEREALQLVGPTHPQRKWALNLLGFIAADRGDYEEAIGFYRRAVAADEGDGFAIAQANWGDALRGMGDPDGAIEHYQKALEIAPSYSFAYDNWGNALADKGDLEAAIGMHARAAKVNPQSAYAYASWGYALYLKAASDSTEKHAEILDEAIAKLRHATELDPRDGLGYFNWGIALEEKGDLDGAIDKYIRATELAPKDPGFFTTLGIALRNKGDLVNAMEKFERAVEIDPGYALAYTEWGVALAGAEDLKGAVEKFEQAARLDSGNADVHFNIGVALGLLGHDSEAADAFERVLALKPDYPNAAEIRGEINRLRSASAGQ